MSMEDTDYEDTDYDITKSEDRAKLMELCGKATAGPWFIEGAHNDYAIMGDWTGGSKDGWSIATRIVDISMYAPETKREDADLICIARTILPAALARIEELEADNGRLRDELAKLEDQVGRMNV